MNFYLMKNSFLRRIFKKIYKILGEEFWGDLWESHYDLLRQGKSTFVAYFITLLRCIQLFWVTYQIKFLENKEDDVKFDNGLKTVYLNSCYEYCNSSHFRYKRYKYSKELKKCLTLIVIALSLLILVPGVNKFSECNNSTNNLHTKHDLNVTVGIDEGKKVSVDKSQVIVSNVAPVMKSVILLMQPKGAEVKQMMAERRQREAEAKQMSAERRQREAEKRQEMAEASLKKVEAQRWLEVAYQQRQQAQSWLSVAQQEKLKAQRFEAIVKSSTEY